MSSESLQEEIEPIVRTLKTLLNDDLKRICKHEGLGVTGVKATLQKKISDRLHDLALSGDAPSFRRLRDVIVPKINNGNSNRYTGYSSVAPFAQNTGSSAPSTPSYRPGNMSAGRSSNTKFPHSPFHTILRSLTSVHEMPIIKEARNTVQTDLTLGGANCDKLLREKNTRVMVYCTSEVGATAAEISFPSQIELKVNESPFQGNLRGIKKKAGTTRPADITQDIRKLANYPNRVTITYAATEKRYVFVVNLVQQHTIEDLVGQIKRGYSLSKKSVLDEINSRYKDTDIVTTSVVMSLKCPISFSRIETPCRSIVCNHNQCFDATSFIQLNEQAPTWTCPICAKTFAFENVVVDQYFQDILNSTPKSTEQVTIEPDGSIRLGAEAGSGTRIQVTSTSHDSTPQANSTYNRPSTGDSSNSLEIADHRAVNGSGNTHLREAISTPQSTTSRITQSSLEPSSAVSSTARSAGSKRAAEEVIDLTLDSDDDSPSIPRPPPVKRQAMGSGVGVPYPASFTSQSPVYRPAPAVSSAHSYSRNSQTLSGRSSSGNMASPASSGSGSGYSFGAAPVFPNTSSHNSSNASFGRPQHQPQSPPFQPHQRPQQQQREQSQSFPRNPSQSQRPNAYPFEPWRNNNSNSDKPTDIGSLWRD